VQAAAARVIKVQRHFKPVVHIPPVHKEFYIVANNYLFSYLFSHLFWLMAYPDSSTIILIYMGFKSGYVAGSAGHPMSRNRHLKKGVPAFVYAYN
jgi:hypothetical protein